MEICKLDGIQWFCGNKIPIFYCAGGGFEEVAKSRALDTAQCHIGHWGYTSNVCWVFPTHLSIRRGWNTIEHPLHGDVSRVTSEENKQCMHRMLVASKWHPVGRVCWRETGFGTSLSCVRRAALAFDGFCQSV